MGSLFLLLSIATVSIASVATALATYHMIVFLENSVSQIYEDVSPSGDMGFGKLDVIGLIAEDIMIIFPFF